MPVTAPDIDPNQTGSDWILPEMTEAEKRALRRQPTIAPGPARQPIAMPSNLTPGGIPLENYKPELVTDPTGGQWAIKPDGTRDFLGQRPPQAEVQRRLQSMVAASPGPPQAGVQRPPQAGVPSTGLPFTGGRPPIAAPAGGGGVPMPDLSKIYQTAFAKLPQDQALKVAKAATVFRVKKWAQQALAAGQPQDQIIRNAMLLMAENERDLAEVARTLPKPATPLQEAQLAHTKAETAHIPKEEERWATEEKAKQTEQALGARRSRAATIYRASRNDLRDLEKTHPATPPPETATPAHKQRWQDEENRIQALRKNIDAYENWQDDPQDQPPPDPTKPDTATANEVVRTTKDGKKAVFDSATKQFLRYAD